MTNMVASARVLCLLAAMLGVQGGTYRPKVEIGQPVGLIPDCPGVMKNASISAKMMPQLKIVSHRSVNGMITRKPMPIMVAPKMCSKDKTIDFKNKKTVLYACGYIDSSVYPQSQAVGTAYLKRGYNVFITETNTFLTQIYPKSVRLTRVIGAKIGEFLFNLTSQGLRPEDLELVGLSLGAHIVGFAAKQFYKLSGMKPSRITGLDPAGPCFRSLSPEFRLNENDATHVDIVHTNIDGFGIADQLGHVDYYVNGGEFQPNDIAFLPCLVLCSHVKAVLFWWQAIEHPKKFIGVKCDSIEDARMGNCHNKSLINYMGRETDFSKPGVYYLSTKNEFPYYKGKDALKEDDDVFLSYAKALNKEDMYEY